MDDITGRIRRGMEDLPVPEDALERLRSREDGRRRRQRRATVLVVVTLTAGALGGTIYLLRGLGPSSDAAVPSAGPRVGTGLAVAPGQYFYERRSFLCASTTDPEGMSCPEGAVASWETWWARDGSGRVHRLADHPGYGEPKGGTYGPGELASAGWWEDLSSLSTDPDVLEEQLADRSASGGASPQPAASPKARQGPRDMALWAAIESLLEFPTASPELRAALYVVASRIPGVERDEAAVDLAGRPAIALSSPSEGGRTTLFFDPGSHQVMSTRTAYPTGEHGFILAAGIVGSAQRPPQTHEYLYPPPPDDLPKRSPGGML